MARGGIREGAGRPKGSSTKRAEQAMQMADEKGIDPVAMLLDLTRWAYDQFVVEQTKANADMVRDYAKEAAPYVRPKLSAVEANAELNGSLTIVSGVPRAGD